VSKQIKKDWDEENATRREEFLAAIARELPPVVFRNWPRWKDVLPMSPRTVANEDCKGEGPTGKVFVGRNAGYSKESFIEYLRKRIHFSEGRN
jgi:hypothetical protein